MTDPRSKLEPVPIARVRVTLDQGSVAPNGYLPGCYQPINYYRLTL